MGIRKPHTWVSALAAPCWDLGWLSGRAPALTLKVVARSPVRAAPCAGPEFTSSAPPPTRHVFSGLTFTFSKGQPGEHKPSLAGPCMSLNEFRAHEVRTQFPARSRQSPGGCTIIDRPSRLGLLWGLPHPAGLQTPAPCPGRVNDQPEPLPPAAERVLLAGDRGPLETTLPCGLGERDRGWEERGAPEQNTPSSFSLPVGQTDTAAPAGALPSTVSLGLLPGSGSPRR